MTVLVTGAAGFIGSHLAERMLRDGHEVVGLDSFDDFYAPAAKERNVARARDFAAFTLVRGDIRDPDLLSALPDTIDTVVHLAARAGVRPSIEDPLLYHEVNVRGTLEILELMRARGIYRLLFGSSSSVYGNRRGGPFSESDATDTPISPYAATKKACELLVHTYHALHGISAVSLRFFTVYGPRQRPDLAIHKFARLMLAGDPIPMYGDGSSERDYTYVDDIVDGVIGALELLDARPGQHAIVNLGGNRPIRLLDMIVMVARALGVTPEIRRQAAQPGDVECTYADLRRARELLGYEPTTSFETGVRSFVAWLERETIAEPREALLVG